LYGKREKIPQKNIEKKKINALPTHQISVGFIALFEQIYYGDFYRHPK
jgi:hypothetical protein